ncbi:unnamed protein product [Angiostrongylus costaricensis]|uniref:Apple domain-containing protein n=1 Tax=Angiostrongylus costaricensis TaxID=334426 RepID=A0A0R3Q233_ANGCS|nr:unnamed protein product [Angiostrongylus costaricensis]
MSRHLRIHQTGCELQVICHHFDETCDSADFFLGTKECFFSFK